MRSFIASHAGADMPDFEAYWRLYAIPSLNNGNDVIFIKRMLQTGLPEALRVECLGALFREFVSADVQSIGAELYMSTAQLQEMIEGGMHVGSHGDKHLRLNKLPPDQQLDEIDRSLEFLKALGSALDDWIICYPYGENDASLHRQLRKRGCAAGLTLRRAVATIGGDDPLTLPRLDTNDLPFQ